MTVLVQALLHENPFLAHDFHTAGTLLCRFGRASDLGTAAVPS